MFLDKMKQKFGEEVINTIKKLHQAAPMDQFEKN
jgi:hypothetical protein